MTDKSARDEIARHYGAYEIGGSLDDMHEFERERCYDFADRQIAALADGVTEEMAQLAVDVYEDQPRLIDHRVMRRALSAAIRAAIPEGK